MAVCDLLLELYALRQPLLSRHTSDVLAALASSTASALPPKALAQLLNAVLAEPAAWEARDSDAALALAQLMREGFVALHHAERGLAAVHLPRAFHALVPQLGAEQEALRAATVACLRELVSDGHLQCSWCSAVMIAVCSSCRGKYMMKLAAYLTKLYTHALSGIPVRG